MINYWRNPSVLVGWTGTIAYWIMENLETVVGMVFSIAMLSSSIVMNIYKTRHMQAEERRREQIHQIRMEKLKDNGNLNEEN